MEIMLKKHTRFRIGKEWWPSVVVVMMGRRNQGFYLLNFTYTLPTTNKEDETFFFVCFVETTLFTLAMMWTQWKRSAWSECGIRSRSKVCLCPKREKKSKYAYERKKKSNTTININLDKWSLRACWRERTNGEKKEALCIFACGRDRENGEKLY